MSLLLKNHVGAGVYHTIAGLNIIELDDHIISVDAVFVSMLDRHMIRESLFTERSHAFELAFTDGPSYRGDFLVVAMGPKRVVYGEEVHSLKLRRLGKLTCSTAAA